MGRFGDEVLSAPSKDGERLKLLQWALYGLVRRRQRSVTISPQPALPTLLDLDEIDGEDERLVRADRA